MVQTAGVLTTRHELTLLTRARPAMAGILLAGRGLARAKKPLVRLPGIGWVTADPVVARAILGDHASFTIIGEGGVGHLWAQILGDWVYDLFDGPGHHDLRSRSRELFTEASSAELVHTAWDEPLARAQATLAAGELLDIGLLARVLVGRMMISLLGIPGPGGSATGDISAPGDTTWPTDDDAVGAFRTGERLAAVALGSAGSTVLSPELITSAQAIVAELTEGVPHGWASSPAHTLLGRCRELGLGLQETTGLASLLMVAGTETSASAMSRTTALLIDTGEQHRLLAARAEGSDLIDNTVREGLRMTSPASVIGRGVSADVVVAGKQLRAGERVMILTWSANTAAGSFAVDRPYNPHTRQLWFGAGRHLCLGAALARAEIATLLRTLWADGPLRIEGRSAQRKVLVPGYESLLVSRVSARP